MKFVSLFFLLIFNILANDFADGKYAIINTSQGEIIIQLEYEQAPLTVINFAGLATGQKENSVKNGKPFYDGLKFHRVISDFMIQGGDPKGNGTGGPGYKFIDEENDLKHDRPGTLSMANSGPNTNGSQFFITHQETPWLDGKHTVFGYVIKGQDVVNNIKKDDEIKSITIKSVGEKAQEFITNEKNFQKYLTKYQKIAQEKFANIADKLGDFVEKNYKNAKKIDDYYLVGELGNSKVKAGDLIDFDLIISADGKVLQNAKNSKTAVGRGRLIPLLDNTLMQMSKNSEVKIITSYYALYGDKPHPTLKNDAVLTFDLKLNKIN
jgi:peptidylprolyl isomerase